jgi:hypothetical protein
MAVERGERAPIHGYEPMRRSSAPLEKRPAREGIFFSKSLDRIP